MHTAQGLGTIAAMRPRLSWVQSAQTVVGPARAPVLRKQKTQSPSKTTHPCAHNEFRCWLNGLVGKGGSGKVRAHIRPFGLKGCALPKRTHPPTTFEELLRAWARGTIAAMRPRLSWVQSAQTVEGPARAPVLRKQKTQSPSETTHPCAHNEFHGNFFPATAGRHKMPRFGSTSPGLKAPPLGAGVGFRDSPPGPPSCPPRGKEHVAPPMSDPGPSLGPSQAAMLNALALLSNILALLRLTG